MIRALFWIFMAMTWYGILVGPLGAGLLSLACAVLVHWASLRFAQQDRAYWADPSNAPKPRCTLEELDRAGVECSGPKNPA